MTGLDIQSTLDQAKTAADKMTGDPLAAVVSDLSTAVSNLLTLQLQTAAAPPSQKQGTSPTGATKPAAGGAGTAAKVKKQRTLYLVQEKKTGR